jgi:DNA-binding transcriptional LysR family regulator
MPNSTSWDDFRLIKAIADSRSLVGAAESLGLNHSTVFRRLGTLEDQLETKLFERSRLGYTPTAAGEDMIALAIRMDEEIREFERSIMDRDILPSGHLRLTTNETFLTLFLAPLLQDFSKLYSDIHLDLILSNDQLNLSRRDADIAIRATREPPETLVGRRICDVPWAHYVPATLEDAQTQTLGWIGFGEALAHLKAQRWLAQNIAISKIRHHVDSLSGLAHLIAAGMGQGILPCLMGDQIKGLRRKGEILPDFGDSIWLLTHPDLRKSARIRAFLDFAAPALKKALTTTKER